MWWSSYSRPSAGEIRGVLPGPAEVLDVGAVGQHLGAPQPLVLGGMALDVRLVEGHQLLEDGLEPPRGIGVLVVAHEHADVGRSALDPLRQVDAGALGPVDAVGRVVGPGADGHVLRVALAHGHRLGKTPLDPLEALRRVGLGIVLDDRPPAVEDDVVPLAAVVLVQAEGGLVPVDPVLALGVAHGPPAPGGDVGAGVPGLEEPVLLVVEHRGRGPGPAVGGVPLLHVTQWEHRVEGVLLGLAHGLVHVVGGLDPVHEQKAVAAASVGVHRNAISV